MLFIQDSMRSNTGVLIPQDQLRHIPTLLQAFPRTPRSSTLALLDKENTTRATRRPVWRARCRATLTGS